MVAIPQGVLVALASAGLAAWLVGVEALATAWGKRGSGALARAFQAFARFAEGSRWPARFLRVTPAVLPSVAMVAAGWLFLRARERYGEWPTMISFLHWEGEEPYFETLATPLVAPYGLASALVQLAIVSPILFVPILAVQLRRRPSAWVHTLLYGVSWLALVCWFAEDPTGSFHWLTT